MLLIILAAATVGTASTRACEAMDASAEQLEKNANFLVALRGDQYKHAAAASELAAGISDPKEMIDFARMVSKTASDEADLMGGVAGDDYKVAKALRSEIAALCR